MEELLWQCVEVMDVLTAAIEVLPHVIYTNALPDYIARVVLPVDDIVEELLRTRVRGRWTCSPCPLERPFGYMLMNQLHPLTLNSCERRLGTQSQPPAVSRQELRPRGQLEKGQTAIL